MTINLVPPPREPSLSLATLMLLVAGVVHHKLCESCHVLCLRNTNINELYIIDIRDQICAAGHDIAMVEG